jgi:hypothetical protein
MTEQKIAASDVERSKLAQRINDANQAKQMADHANAVAGDLFTMFCEAHGVPGATFKGITEDGFVIVTVPDAPKPALVEEPSAA